MLLTCMFEEFTEETSSRDLLRVMRPGSGISPTANKIDKIKKNACY